MQAPVTHISALSCVRRLRLLPGKGQVLVKEGQKVSASDIVAEGWAPGKHALVDLRRSLGVERADEAEKLLLHGEGDWLKAKDVIAQTHGLLPQRIHADSDCRIVAIHHGRVLLELEGQTIRLAAGFAGTVMRIIEDLGVELETHGALIQGMWGNDRFNQGVLLSLAQKPDDELTDQRLDVSMRGAVVFAGPCASAAALRMAEEMPLRGLILSSLAPELLEQAAKMTVPVILVEGVGKLPYSTPAFKILSTNEKRDACLKASKPDHFSGERPEIILPLPAAGQEAPAALELRPGQLVRVAGLPAAGRLGTLTHLRPGLTRLGNGLAVQAAEIRLENNELVTVPVANLEILE